MPTASSGERRMQLGKYRLVEHIATGGMGAVYKAVNEQSGREVALKVLSPEMAARPAMRERLRREAMHGAKLSHEHIVDFIEFAEADGTFFLAMEYVHGKNLDEYIERQGPLAPDLAEYILRQIVVALDHVHRLGFIHRDIKPSNILLTRKDGKPVAKLADLGLIRETSDEEFRLTREGHTVGTVDYLAPEQARDSGLADIRSDIYSLGCTFYQMLTGFAPFAEGNLTERLFKHAEIEAPDVRVANPKAPAKLAAICRRMLAKKPDKRYQTPAELLADLDQPDPARATASDEAVTAEPSVTPTETPKSRPMTSAQRAAEANFNLAQKLIADGNMIAGLPLLFTCCRLEPAQISYRQELREALKNVRSADTSSGWWSRVRSAYHLLRLKTARRLSKPLQVLEHGEYVLAAQPKHLTTHLQMAEAALTCRFNDLGRWFLEQATYEHGPHPLLNRALALYWERVQDFRQAMSFWEMVAAADPDHAEARFHLKQLSAQETMARGRYQDRIETRLLDSDQG
jgi:serine/threonine protein kinase